MQGVIYYEQTIAIEHYWSMRSNGASESGNTGVTQIQLTLHKGDYCRHLHFKIVPVSSSIDVVLRMNCVDLLQTAISRIFCVEFFFTITRDPSYSL